MADRIKVRVVIEYETELGEPDAYEGETTAEGKAAKEVEYIKDGGDYLVQALSFLPHTMDVETTVLTPQRPDRTED